MKSEIKPGSELESEDLEHPQGKKKWQTPRFERHDAKQSTLASKLFFATETAFGSAGPTS
jgi:hypothetical protein